MAAALLVLVLAGIGVLVAQRRQAEEDLVGMRTLARYGTKEPGFTVAVSPEQWESLWQSLVQKPERPAVDFEKEWVVAAFMGESLRAAFAFRWTK